jgi:hypothetical protein
MTSPHLTPGTILIPINETEATVITLPADWHQEVIREAQHHHSCINGLDTAKQRLTNPDHESGNTALIREEIRQALIHLAYTTGSALTHLAEAEEAS